MFLLLGLNFYLIFNYKFSEAAGRFTSFISAVTFLFLSQTMTNKNLSLTLVFLFTFLTCFAFGSKMIFSRKRKFFSLSLTHLPFFSLMLVLILNLLAGPKITSTFKEIVALSSGALIGLIFQALVFIPYGFNSYKEYFHFMVFTKNKTDNFKSLITCLTINPANWLTTKELLTQINAKDLDQNKEGLQKVLVNLVFYWTQQTQFNSLNPLVKKINDISFEQIKKNLVVFDLTDSDVDLIFNIFRCGCWKPGLFILDQYLVANKLSLKYPSALIFADKFIHDLKKASFDDESIENWLKYYSAIFKGTPISQKINLIYHNKDDWFNPEIRHAAL